MAKHERYGLSPVIRAKRVRNSLLLVLPIIALIVVLIVFWWLKLTGITMAGEAFCGIDEHSHSEECYEKTLLCTLTELEEEPEQEAESALEAEPVQQAESEQPAGYLCGLEEHHHDEVCSVKTLLCEEDHAHLDECFEIGFSCGLDEHVHTSGCSPPAEEVPTEEVHTHTEECYETTLLCEAEEHIHDTSCYTDIHADNETAENWEATMAMIPDGLRPEEKIICVADSQLGYTESERNFSVDADGVRHGYTRYGAWYGNPYGEWSSMFTSFCLRYGGMSEVPISAGADTMRLQWEKEGLYRDAENYLPNMADVVFLDLNENGTVETTAIAARVHEGILYVIQGDAEDCVQEVAYEMHDPRIIGFGATVEKKPVPVKNNGVAAVAEGTLGKTISFNTTLLDAGGPFIIYVQSGKNYYAIDGNGNQVQISIDGSGNVTSNVGDPNLIYWTFERHNENFDNRPSYYIQNISTKNYLHPTSGGPLLTGRWESALYQSGNGAKLRAARQDYYVRYNWGFTVTNRSNEGTVLNFAQVETGQRTVWLDGTNGGLMSLGGSDNRNYNVGVGQLFTLPETWKSPDKYNYTLRGWYDVKNQKYYQPGAEVIINENTVFYADWVASTYDVGVYNSHVSDTISTNEFITTHVFDYNMLFNLMSESSVVSANAGGHSEQWYLVADGTAPHTGEETLNFIFSDYDGNGDISYPNSRNSANVSGDVYSGLFNERLEEVLFSTENGFDPATGTGILGKSYLGTADHLFKLDTDPTSENYGYYYYDSRLNAASYNQSDSRFYVYDYLERTSDSQKDGGAGAYSDFLPFNSPYLSVNNKNLQYYNYAGENGEYPGINHVQYDAKYDGQGSASGNVNTNYHFGMSIDIDFYLPEAPGSRDAQGNYGNQDVYGKDMHFKFSGDDDVWVLVDGKLVLDIGGIHGVESGDINFSTGVVTVNGQQVSTLQGIGEGSHTLTVYYLERGSSQSNCAIYFNLAPRFSLGIQKEDTLTQDVLNGAQFSVYTDKGCTQPAQLWTSEEAYKNGETAVNTFTVENGTAKMWGLSAGKTYYIKETRPPDHAEYSYSRGIICLTLDKQGAASYEVEILGESQNENVSEGFTVHGFRIDEETQQAYIVATNAPTWVEDTTQVQVSKVWNDRADHTYDSVTVYLTITDEDGTVRRIREVELSGANNWSYSWSNLPKYWQSGALIHYGVEEAYKNGYYATVEQIGSSNQFTYKITNTPLDKETSVQVYKEWDAGPSGSAAYEKEQVTMKLLANGKDTGRTVTLSLKNGWSAVFQGLPLTDADGNTIRYTVEESWDTEDWFPTYGEVITVEGKVPTYKVTVTNLNRKVYGYELPSTGGLGPIPWVLSGTAIMAAALVCGILLRRKQRGRRYRK